MTRSTARPQRQPPTEWQTRPLRRDVVPPPAPPARRSRSLAWEATLALLALAIVVAGVATLLFLEMWLADRIVPGVYVWDVDLGGLTREEAAERLVAMQQTLDPGASHRESIARAVYQLVRDRV